VAETDGRKDLVIGTRNGMAIRFKEEDARPMGRSARGVRGIQLRDGDEVVAMKVVSEGATLLTVCERGYGKRTELDEYRRQSRGGIGLKNVQTSDRNGLVVGIACVAARDELLIVTEQGQIIRMTAGDLRPIGRDTQGVRLMDELARCVPDHLWLTGATQEAGSSISLEGVTYSNLVVSDFMSRLERSAMFDGVELTVAERSRIADRDLVKFRLTCQVTPDEPAN